MAEMAPEARAAFEQAATRLATAETVHKRQVEMVTKGVGLEAERQACDAGLALPALVDRFEHRLHGCAGTTVDSAAALIASAFLDERAGIAGALEHTTTWFADPARFSSDWVAAVHELTASLGDLGGSAC